MPKKSTDTWQFGDFQTPIELARTVVEVLKRNHDIQPDIVIEPTCGKGTFIRAACEGFDCSKILGFEINPAYVEEAKYSLAGDQKYRSVIIKEADFFSTDWNKIISENNGYILIIGNPPWVTNSELSLLNSKNIPEKSNFQNRKGIEAITGYANFDISEWMLLKQVEWLSQRNGTIALLCKYSVARKVIFQIKKKYGNRFFGNIYPIDTKTYFSASVEACLFVLTTNKGKSDCAVYDTLYSLTPSHLIGERDGYIVKNIIQYEKWKFLQGKEIKYIWRSGVKHDCSKIMELEPLDGSYKNGFGETVYCEEDFVYPLLKSSDIGNGRIKSYRKVVLLTQKFVGEDTSKIRILAPKTWEYLIKNKEYLNKRKSSIYKNKPIFSIFGIGEYSFKNWKIAISGLYKTLKFHFVEPLCGKTVVFDDTVNFLSFSNKEEAEFVYRMITSVPATEFYESMVFWDEKRPITTELLKRLSMKALAEELGLLAEYQKWNCTQMESMQKKLPFGAAAAQLHTIRNTP